MCFHLARFPYSVDFRVWKLCSCDVANKDKERNIYRVIAI